MAEQFGIAEYFLKPPTHELIVAVTKALQEQSQHHGEVKRLDPKSVKNEAVD
jgi:hypothetical protein